jgi:hypothetical protein
MVNHKYVHIHIHFDAFVTFNISCDLRMPENGEMQEQIDEGDEDLKELKTKWGEDVYKAVTKALLEMNEVNASGSYAVPEIWNLMEDRRASMKEIIQYIIKQLRAHMRKRKRC